MPLDKLELEGHTLDRLRVHHREMDDVEDVPSACHGAGVPARAATDMPDAVSSWSRDCYYPSCTLCRNRTEATRVPVGRKHKYCTIRVECAPYLALCVHH